jgi:hypothetical protein
MARDDRHIPLNEQQEFVRLELNVKTLARLLSRHELHAEDVHCDSRRSKQILMKLILKTASLDVQPAKPFLIT